MLCGGSGGGRVDRNDFFAIYNKSGSFIGALKTRSVGGGGGDGKFVCAWKRTIVSSVCTYVFERKGCQGGQNMLKKSSVICRYN